MFQIAAEVSAPLSKTGEIVLIGGNDKVGQEVNKLLGTLPPAVQALTGVDVSGVRRADRRRVETVDELYCRYWRSCQVQGWWRVCRG